MTTLYGIPNCDTVKKSRAWFDAQDRPYTFHDFKKQGVPEGALNAWIQALGWQALLNQKGTTWRKLDDVTKTAVLDAASAKSLMLTQPSVIKRPVVEWSSTEVTVGFDAAGWQLRLK